MQHPIHWYLAVAACGILTSRPAYPQNLVLNETESQLHVLHGDKTLLVYNKQSPPVPDGIDPVYHRSGFIHPVNTLGGKTVTAAFPEDHPHQHGIFSAWVKTTFKDREIDFWNLGGRTGRVVHEDVIETQSTGNSVSFSVHLLHRGEQPKVDILRERWSVRVYSPMENYYRFDLDTQQQAVTPTPLKVHQYHYGGMALRGPTRWLKTKDKDLKPEEIEQEPGQFLNDRGHDRLEGNHEPTTWVMLSGDIDHQSVSIVVLGHPQNLRAPQPARLHGTKPYFCFSPCVTEAFEIDQDHPIRGRYRYLVADQIIPREWIEREWKEFALTSLP